MITVTTLGLMTPFQKHIETVDALAGWLEHVGYLRRDWKRELDVQMVFNDNEQGPHYLVWQRVNDYIRSHRVTWDTNKELRLIADLINGS